MIRQNHKKKPRYSHSDIVGDPAGCYRTNRKTRAVDSVTQNQRDVLLMTTSAKLQNILKSHASIIIIPSYFTQKHNIIIQFSPSRLYAESVVTL